MADEGDPEDKPRRIRAALLAVLLVVALGLLPTCCPANRDGMSEVMMTRILGGAPPRSMLHEIPWKQVASVGVTVRLTATELPSDADWVERWLRDHIVARIPGGRHAAE
ncbi:hypothetical protein [Mycobacterium sp. DL440]|uniref:hypothetical protein n=1 Tax=Mycobacterium sp. DL440 TaxID=2675523 RepID=UPI001FBA68C8|nr:hypothetical protein [Mycobacterium sp. DL440]